MRDFLANEIKVGDLVAATAAGYCDLHVWTVIKVNPKTVNLEREEVTRHSNGTTYTSKQRVRRSRTEFILIRIAGD